MFSARQRSHILRVLCIIIAMFLLTENVFAQVSDDRLIQSLQWRNLGPANMGGRVSDFEAVDDDYRIVFLAAASGGVWKSTNAGTTWKPVFDNYPSASIGDIAIFQPNPDIVWVGTGEANNRNSVAWGDGIYKSTDGGETFTNMGLKETHQIARIITHPKDPDIVYVAAIGHLWGLSGDRGLFKTTDGGKTWTKLTKGLPDDGKTGANDIVMDSKNPNTLYVSFYERLRRPWTFHSGGPSGGIYKSTNGGKSWKKLTKGLPKGNTGRIGLAIYRKNPKILMALVEAERSDDLNVPGSGVYRSENGGNSWKYVNTFNLRPFYYSQIRINPLDDQRVYVLTTQFRVSYDGGKTLDSGSPVIEGNFDNHAMWLDPNDKDRYYLGNDKGPNLTHDHGQTMIFFDNLCISQYYAIGVDMRDPYYVYGGLQDNGTWGGPSFSRDARGILSDDNWKLHWGDGMYIQIDPADWRKVYTEAENGSFRRYDPETRRATRMQPNASNTTNYEQFVVNFVPQGRSRSPFRFNWTSPMVMSPHNPEILFLGGNFLFKTVDAGEHWEIVSPDLTTNDPEKYTRKLPEGVLGEDGGAESHCSITTFSESPLTPGLYWVGTDDGRLHVTRDGGKIWTDIRRNVPDVPEGIWVTRVEASHFDEGTAYATFEGHRSDIFVPYVFKTTDYGQNWENITNNIPGGQAVYVIKEDLKNPNLLFVGTEFACFFSINGGKRWTRLMNNLPTVAIHDLTIHPRDNDLIAGTHGRGIWILDDITPLQQFTEEVQESDAFLFENRQATIWENVSRGGQRGSLFFAGQNPPSIETTSTPARARFNNTAIVTYYLKSKPVSPALLEISDINGENKHTVELDGEAGINRYKWNLQFGPAESPEMRRQREEAARQRRGGGFGGREPAAGPGKYFLKLTVNGNEYTSILTIRQDPMLDGRK